MTTRITFFEQDASLFEDSFRTRKGRLVFSPWSVCIRKGVQIIGMIPSLTEPGDLIGADMGPLIDDILEVRELWVVTKVEILGIASPPEK